MGWFSSEDDTEFGQVVYEDHTFLLGRKVYRDLQCGKKVDESEAGKLISLDSPPLSSYFSFFGRK